jgi:hypothetical protein
VNELLSPSPAPNLSLFIFPSQSQTLFSLFFKKNKTTEEEGGGNVFVPNEPGTHSRRKTRCKSKASAPRAHAAATNVKPKNPFHILMERSGDGENTDDE